MNFRRILVLFSVGSLLLGGCASAPPCPNEPTLAQKWGGMTYVNWHFNLADLHEIVGNVDVVNDPGNTSDLYLQIYDANIDGSGQYFGIQTTGLVIFSRFGTADASDGNAPSGSTLTVDGNPFNGEGSSYISVRRNFGSLPVGHYRVRVVRTTFDGTGDWFSLYVTFPSGSETLVGSLRFPRQNPNVPARFRDGGGTWTEFWANNGPFFLRVPEWRVRTAVTANGDHAPVTVISSYSPMPNADIFRDTSDGYVVHVLGGCTERLHPAGKL